MSKPSFDLGRALFWGLIAEDKAASVAGAAKDKLAQADRHGVFTLPSFLRIT